MNKNVIIGCIYAAFMWISCSDPGQQNPVGAIPEGSTIFRKNCVVCHGADGKLGMNGAKDLSMSVLPLEERINTITNGRNVMTPFKALLSPEEIKAVAQYTLSLKK
ncbi:MAG: cytochrome c [Bacteroidota bacterium]